MNDIVIIHKILGEAAAIALIEKPNGIKFWRIRVRGTDINLTEKSIKNIDKIELFNKGNS